MVVRLDKEIEDKYEILELMAEGGMGAVYKARHRRLKVIRVIKTSKFTRHEADKIRFLSEAERGAQFDHRNIARVFDFDVTKSGTAYIVMEYIDGLNLREVLNTSGVLPVSRTVEIALDALDALRHLHENGFVHRDISPENLMLTNKSQVVKLIDLGIAKSLEHHSQSLTADGKFIGKVKYAAPEQFRGEADPRSDVYSLGMVMYELLTGTLPFKSNDSLAIMAAQVSGEPLKSFDETDPDGKVPRRLRNVVMRALQHAPILRFESAKDFIGALRDSQQPEKPADQTAVVDVPKIPPKASPEEVAWVKARAADTQKAFSDFIKLHPASSHLPAARARRKELVDIEERDHAAATTADTAEAWQSFLKKHPDSEFAPQVQARLRDIEAEQKDWEAAERVNLTSSWREFIRKHPKARRIVEAQERLDAAAKREAEDREWDAAFLAGTIEGWKSYLSVPRPPARRADAQIRIDALQEAADWALAERTGTSDAWRKYLSAWPKSMRSSEAEQKLAVALQHDAEGLAWEDAAALSTVSAWRNFLTNYPNGLRREEATQRLEAVQRADAEVRAWDDASREGTSVAWSRYLEQFPDSTRANAARQNLAAAKAFEAATESDTVRAWNDFLASNPNSRFTNDARNRLAAARDRENEQQAFAEAERVDDVDSWNDVVRRFPNSARIEEAERRLAAARATAARDAALRDGTLAALRSFLVEWPQSVHTVEIAKKLNERETSDYADAEAAGTSVAWRGYLDSWPDSEHSAEAGKRLADAIQSELAERAWESAGTIEELRAFVAEYPELHREEADQRIEELERVEAEAARQRLAIARAFQNAQELDTVAAWNDFLDTYRDSSFTSHARNRLAAAREREREQQAFAEAESAGTIEAWNAFIRGHPQSPRIEQAEAGLAHARAKAAYDAALRTGTPAAFQKFVANWPQSAYTAEIAGKLAEVREKERLAAEARAKEERAWTAAKRGSAEELKKFAADYPASAHRADALKRVAGFEARLQKQQQALVRAEEKAKAKARASEEARQRKAAQPPRRPLLNPRVFVSGMVTLVLLAAGVKFMLIDRAKPAPLPGPVQVAKIIPPPPTTTTTAAPVTTTVPPEPGVGQLLINAYPWGEVKSIKDDQTNSEHVTARPFYTPVTMTLPVGSYTVQLSNPNSKKTADCRVQIQTGKRVECKASLDTFDANEYLGRIAESQ